MLQLQSVSSHYAWSSLLAQRAAREAAKVKDDPARVAAVVVAHQATAASRAGPVSVAMLAEQGIDERPVASVNPAAFTADPAALGSMLDQADVDWQFAMIVASLVQEAGRSASSAAITATPGVGYVRHLSPPSCSRCAVLAGKFFKWNDGFQRHPGCDCVHLPTTQASAPGLISDPSELLASGQVTGLSKADIRALNDGADWSQVINAKSGLMRADMFGRSVQVTTSGTTVRGLYGSRAGNFRRTSASRYRTTTRARLTPNEIYRIAGDNRTEAIRLLKSYGYLL